MIRELFEKKLRELADEQTANDILADEECLIDVEDGVKEVEQDVNDKLDDIHRYALELLRQELSCIAAVIKCDELGIIDADRVEEEINNVASDGFKKLFAGIIDMFGLDCNPDVLLEASKEVSERVGLTK